METNRHSLRGYVMWIYCSVQNSSLQIQSIHNQSHRYYKMGLESCQGKRTKQRVDLKLIPEEASLSWGFLSGTSEISYNTEPSPSFSLLFWLLGAIKAIRSILTVSSYKQSLSSSYVPPTRPTIAFHFTSFHFIAQDIL